MSGWCITEYSGLKRPVLRLKNCFHAYMLRYVNDVGLSCRGLRFRIKLTSNGSRCHGHANPYGNTLRFMTDYVVRSRPGSVNQLKLYPRLFESHETYHQSLRGTVLAYWLTRHQRFEPGETSYPLHKKSTLAYPRLRVLPTCLTTNHRCKRRSRLSSNCDMT